MRHKATAEADPRHAGDNVEPFLAGAPRSVGEHLRNTREDLGLELRQVSDSLRIRYAHLRAIEESRFSELPGQTYAVGFVRTYAEYLGLDSRALVELFKEEISGIPRATQLVFPTPKPEGKIPGGALVLISLLLVGLAYGGWYAFNEYEGELTSLIVSEAPPASLAEGDIGAGQDGPVADGPEAEGRLPDAPADDLPVATGEAEGTSQPTPEDSRQVAVTPGEPTASAAGTPALPGTSGEPLADTAPSVGQAVGDTALQPAADDGDETSERQEIPTTANPVAEAPATQTSASETATDTATGTSAPGNGAAEEFDPRLPAQEAAEASGSLVHSAEQPEAPSAPEVAAPVASLVVLSPSTIGPGAASQERAAVAAAEDSQAVTDLAPQPTFEPAPQAASEPAPQTTVAREETIPVPPIPEAPADQQGRSARVFGTANTDARIVLRATADSWVQVRNARSDLLFTQVLRAGDSYNVPNGQGLTLLTGNAGGLEILVDGQPAPSLGPSGAVRRDIELDPARLLQGAP